MGPEPAALVPASSGAGGRLAGRRAGQTPAAGDLLDGGCGERRAAMPCLRQGRAADRPCAAAIACAAPSSAACGAVISAVQIGAR